MQVFGRFQDFCFPKSGILRFWPILAFWLFQYNEVKILADLNILAFQHPEFKILADFKIFASQNPEFKILGDFRIVPFQDPEFKILADFNILAFEDPDPDPHDFGRFQDFKPLNSRFWAILRF